MNNHRYLAAIWRFAGTAIAALAIGNVAVSRPLDTDDTGTAARGTWELEGGVDFVRHEDAEAFALTPVLVYGLTDRLQLDIGCDYLMEAGVAGEPDAESLRPSLQLKSRFWEAERAGLSLGLAVNYGRHMHVKGPDLDINNSGHVRFLLTKALGAVEVDVNAGYDFAGAWGDGDDAYMISSGVRHALTDAVTLVGEVFSSIPDRGGKASSMVAIGGKLDAGRGWTLDMLVGRALDSGGPDFRLVVGFVRAL